MRITIFFLFVFLCSSQLPAQSERQNQGTGFLLDFSYAISWPGADLADRFGQHFSPGLSAEWITEPKHFFFGLDGHFIFGQQVRMDVLAPLRSPEGYIYGNDKAIADIQLRQRGFYFGGKVGKIIFGAKDNPRSGIKISLGAGFLQHKIRIQEDPARSVPQLEGDYKKGYDRLSAGWALRQFVGYQMLGPERRLNFFIGVESMQAFTAGRRSFNFDTKRVEADSRFDFSYGIRAGWILPFYYGKAQDERSY